MVTGMVTESEDSLPPPPPQAVKNSAIKTLKIAAISFFILLNFVNSSKIVTIAK